MSVAHAKRPRLRGVVLVTQHLCPGLPGLRRKPEFQALARALRAGNERAGFRVLAFSALTGHLHYAVEAESTEALSRGMQGLAIRVAKALNRVWGRKGQVFRERFHARLARGVGAVRRVLRYVLQNARRHGVWLEPGTPDPYSSGPWYRFWRGRRRSRVPREPSPVAEPRALETLTAVTGIGIGLDDVPPSRAGPDGEAW